MGMEIDSLDIAIKAQAKDVASEVNSLYAALDKVAGSLSRSTSGFRSATREAGRMVAAFKSLSNVKLPNFTDTINQVATLGKVLEKIENKKVSIDVDLNLPKSEKQLTWAIDSAAESAKAKSKEISQALIEAFSMGDKTAEMAKARRQLRAAVDQMVAETNAAFDGISFGDGLKRFGKDGSFDKIFKIIAENGKIAAEKIGDEAKIASASVAAVFHNSIGDIRSKISELSDPTLYARAEQAISESVNGAMYAAENNVRDAFERIMKAASGQLTLDVDVNQEKIIHDIQSAIQKAAALNYKPVEVKLAINKSGISDTVTKALQGVDIGKLPQVSSAYEKLFESIKNVHTVLSKSNPINSMVNSLTRLASVDLRKFDIDRFKGITSVISDLSKMPDVSTTVAKLVSALSRLASAGNTVETTSKFLPALGDEIKTVFEKISSAHVDEISERVLQAFTKIVTSGKKAEESAKNLPAITSSVKAFFDEMSKAPNVTETTVRMVEAYAQLSTSGRKLGSVNQNVANSFSNVGNTVGNVTNGFQKIKSAAETVISAFKRMFNAFKSTVKGIVSDASKITSTFNTILGATINPVGAIKKFGNALMDAGNKAGIVAPKLNKVTFSLKSLLQAVLPLMGIRQLFQWGKEAIELSSDLTEVQNVVENSFGSKGTDAINTFARTAKEQFGMTELTAKQIASRFQAMGNAMGLTTGMIEKTNRSMAGKIIKDYEEVGNGMGNMSTRLTMLCADMASFYNVEQETVAQALSAVYTGQTRPLRQFGLDLTQATLAEWALKRGIDAEIDSMSQAEKTMLRYQYVLENTSSIQGDFYRTSQTWANQTRLLQQNLQALGGVVGGTLINAFRPFVVALNSALSVVISFAETVGNALGKIFGWKILHTPASNAADVFDTLADSMEGAGNAGSSAAEGIGDAVDSANNASGSGSSGGSSGNSGNSSSNSNKNEIGIEKDDDYSDSNDNEFDGSGLVSEINDTAEAINDATQASEIFKETVSDGTDVSFGIDDEVVAVIGDATEAAEIYKNTVLGFDELNNVNDGSQFGEDAANSIEKATEAAQEYKNTILGFDELNVLNDVTESANAAADSIKDAEKAENDKSKDNDGESGSGSAASSNNKDDDNDSKDKDKDKNSSKSGSSSGSGSGSGGSGSGGGGIADAKGADFELVDSESWFEDYKSEIDTLFELGRYISDTLAKALESIDWNSIYEKARGFGTGLADFLNGLITPDLFSALGKTIAGSINTALNAADAFLDRFDFGNLGRSLAAGINRFFSTFDFGLASKVFYKSVNGIADAIKEAADNIQWGTIGNKVSECVRNALLGIQWNQKVFPAVESLGRGLASYLNGLINPATFGVVGETLGNVLNTALHFLDSFGSTFNFTGFGRSVASGINGMFSSFDFGLTARTFSGLANGIFSSIKGASDNIRWGEIGTRVSSCVRDAFAGINWNGTVYPAASSFGKGLASFLNGLITPETFGTLGKTIASAINTKLKVLNTFGNTFDFTNFGNSIAAAIRRFFSTWNPKLEAETFMKLAKGVLTSIREAIGGVNWTSVGSKIRVMLTEIDWFGLLRSVGTTIMEALNGALDLAVGIFDGTPVEDAIKKMKSTINDIAGKIDFDKVKDGLQSIFDIGSKFAAGFLEGLTDALGVIAKVGGAAALFIGWIADGLNKIDPDLVKNIGYALGIVGASLLTINTANKAVTTIKGLASTLTGVGTSAQNAATGTANAASAMGNASGQSESLLSSVLGLSNQFLANLGVTALVTKEIKSLGEVSEDVKLVGLLTSLDALRDKGYITTEQMRNLSTSLSVGYACGDDLSETVSVLKSELGNLGVKTEDLNSIYDTWVKYLDEAGYNAEEQKEILKLLDVEIENATSKTDQHSKSVEFMKKAYENTGKTIKETDPELHKLKKSMQDAGTEAGKTAGNLSTVRGKLSGTASVLNGEFGSALGNVKGKSETANTKVGVLAKTIDNAKTVASNSGSAFKDKLGSALDTVKDKSASADTKTGKFKTNLWNFAGGIAGQAILMAVMGTTFENLGSKSDQAKDKITQLKNKIGEFVKNISSWAPEAKRNAETIGTNLVQGMMNSVDAKKGSLQNLVKKAFVDDPKNAMTSGWGISGNSKVTYEYGTKIAQSLIDSINAKAGNVNQTIKTTMADQPKNTLVSTWQISGNSRVTYDYATKIVKGMLDSIKAYAGSLYQNVKTNMGEQPKNAIVSEWRINGGTSSVSKTYGTTIIQSFIAGLSEKNQNVIKVIRELMSEIRKAITENYSGFSAIGKTLLENLKSGMRSVSFANVTADIIKSFNFTSLNSSMQSAGYNCMSYFSFGMKNYKLPMPHFYFDYDLDMNESTGAYTYTYHYGINWYKLGGFPNMGDLFWANENGMPELVGRMGNRSVVANNMQIEQGIKSAVVDGMMQVFMATQGSQDNSIPYQFNINMVTPDGEVLARQVEKGQARREARFNPVGYAVR